MTFLLVLCFFGLAGGIIAIKDASTGKGKGIGALVMLGCIIGMIAIFSAIYVPYNPKAAQKKKQQQIYQQQENKWLEDNFGNGKGQEIFNAIDNYKNGD